MVLSYLLLDVFTDRAFGGNPLAVFHREDRLPATLMQAVARELNLSESTFVEPTARDDCDLRLRIFTPSTEIPMAGHPTLGSAAALAHLGVLEPGEHRFEEGVGPVDVQVERDGSLWRARMRQQSPSFGAPVRDPGAISEALSLERADLDPALPVQTVSCGVPYVIVPLRGLAAARRAAPRVEHWEAAFGAGTSAQPLLFCLETESEDAQAHARMFAPAYGVLEDPATGSAAGPLGAYLHQHAVLGDGASLALVVEQGLELGRPSRLEVAVAGKRGADDWRVHVGGLSVVVGEGRLAPPT